ncbi:MAG: molecular chaperone HtpG [Eubacterium sp.]|nr:molecular chaperone HtpG [Eubacterium sp.]
MMRKNGSLSINSENIFPIIKKWMYSDRDIFIRELISNCCDAITKIRKLDAAGESDLPDDYKPKIEVIVNDKEKTLKFIDNGLGMTADEVSEYINQIAFSGAASFMEKYKDKADEDQIIGHFGLGFYSAFMVSDIVHIDTKSFIPDAEPVHWECDGSTEFMMDTGDRTEMGTEITLFLNEDSLEFANEYRVKEVIEKYCSFMPYEIYVSNPNAEVKYDTIDEEDLKDDDQVVEHIHVDAVYEDVEGENGEKEKKLKTPAKETVKIVRRPVPENDTAPLWTKHPNDCTDEDYKAFYRKVFKDYREPLFWIHLNMDYPFNIKGILYFPQIDLKYESIEGVIKLYNNQVFIADNIKEVIPQYLLLLKGVIDCPDLPLNVSRSALQNDGFAQKISDYISKKVADKLSGMCKTDRENYEKYWDGIDPFIKYGCLKDEKFCERMMDYILYKDIEDEYQTLSELKEIEKGNWKARKMEEEDAKAAEEETSGTEEDKPAEAENTEEKPADEDKTEEEGPDSYVIYYVSDMQQQGQYVNMFREQGKEAVILSGEIDAGYIGLVERKHTDVRFERIDADIAEDIRSDDDNRREESKAMTSLFKKVLGKEEQEVQVRNLKNDSIASVMTMLERERRLSDSMKRFGRADMYKPNMTLVLNGRNPMVQYVLEHKDDKDIGLYCEQLYDLALLASQPLTAEQMTKFIARSNEIMLKAANKEQ